MILRIKAVCSRVGLSRSTIYAKIKSGDFPAPIRLSTNMLRRCAVGWLESDVNEWVENCAKTGGKNV